tara:strand:+ start:1256 stop:1576 length:321 start_codon:yes stop_codon:yes gene_type:complete
MSKDQYLMMCEQTGEEIDWEKCPPAYEDFPDIVHDALNIYNSLGNRIMAEVGYTGKDFTNFNFILELYKVQDFDKDFLMEILLFLDSREIEASQKAIKQAYDKMKK